MKYLRILKATLISLVSVFAFTQFASALDCTVEQGQLLIDQGQYKQAVKEFSCVINAQPTEVEGYRGRTEAQLLLGEYANAYHNFAELTAYVLPVHPDAEATILSGYDARLAATPNDIAALTGASFTRWCFWDYPAAIHLLNQLLGIQPNDVYGNLFRGSSRFLQGSQKAQGKADLDRAITLAPDSPDVRFIVADAYTYGQPDLQRAFAEATLALNWGLDTARVHAILATAYLAFGDQESAAVEYKKHIDLVTTELITTTAIEIGDTLSLDLLPGRTFRIPVSAAAGETIFISTSSADFYDSILVLLAPDGTPVVGSDDENKYFAAIEWVAPATGTYMMQVTSFESVNTGELFVTRD